MRAAIVLAMSLIAAFVPPMRQACASTCIVEVQPPSCHETAAAPAEHAPDAPLDDECSHDHSGTLKQSDAPLLIGNLQSVICNLSADYKLPITDSQLPSTSPPPLFLPLRI